MAGAETFLMADKQSNRKFIKQIQFANVGNAKLLLIYNITYFLMRSTHFNAHSLLFEQR